MVSFVRRTWHKYSKLGRGRKKKQVWRKPTGRHNKMREERNGVPAIVKIGYGEKAADRETIRVIRNLRDIEKIVKNEVIVLGKVGKRKKIELAEELKRRKIQVQNINVVKFLKSEKVMAGKRAGQKTETKPSKEDGKKNVQIKPEKDKK
ncbi:MAG: hypothetical protein KJ905_00040 [Nanoarchaeota archaeon]|nr:hypothetical protein [Nanoarchaeota archaeon]MBU1501150.1 hypothetical protein [Nanoarchaeota archaeon]MBU2458830.1 hypothetical protein [Nanoarchaeota archaeon]